MLTTTATDLPRLMHCIGSYYMAAALPPDTDTEKRDEGNAAHWLAKERFDGRLTPVGSRAYNGYIITDEMSEHADTYLSALDCGEMEIDTSHGGDDWYIGGRADHIKGNDRAVVIDDFKYGHRLVRAEGNYTLISHAIGWCVRNGVAPARITLRIHQPRAYHSDGPLREWTISYLELMEYHQRITDRLSQPDKTLNTSVEDHCANCHALATCPAARMAGMNAIDASCMGFNDSLPDNVLTWEYETLRTALIAIENRSAALEELITHRIRSGTVVHGYALKPRYANRRWREGVGGHILTALTGVDCVKDGSITPAEALRRGVPEAVLNAMTERPTIGHKLERMDVDRNARKAFGNG